jgi:hypothetical protein
MNRYIDSLNKSLIDPEFSTYKIDIEDYNIFKDLDPYEIRAPNKIGVSGIIAPTAKYVEDFLV